MSQGKAIIFSAPSGSGKTTIIKNLLKFNKNLDFSISACTRGERGGKESPGRDYFFLSEPEFKKKIKNGEFIEWEEVYPGKFYGTLKSEVERIWDEGKHVLFDVDVKGGLTLKNYFKEKALAIFVKAPSIETLKKRLISRKTESRESIAQRIYKAEYELKFEDKFDVTLVNDNLDDSIVRAQNIINDFLIP